jgi:hypothetical protein
MGIRPLLLHGQLNADFGRMTSMVKSKSDDTGISDSEEWFNEARNKGYTAGNGSQID